MTIDYQILGKPGRDNALLVRIDSGQSISRLLFDCGDRCLDELSISEIQSIDALFFSHFHMDHVGGFDSFFRCTFGRDTQRNDVYGPADTTSILHHRFQGFWWNLCSDLKSTWRVHDITVDSMGSAEFQACDGFQQRKDCEPVSHDGTIVAYADYTVQTIELAHNGPSLAYRVNEANRTNVDTDRMKELRLKPGPWLRQLKDGESGTINVGDQSLDLDELRSKLLTTSKGDSIAYLTDFLLDDAAHERLVPWLRGCNTVVCEAQYRHADSELATRNYHTTTKNVGQLAAAAEVGELKLFHLSDRYSNEEWLEMLAECRSEFANTSFADEWQLPSYE